MKTSFAFLLVLCGFLTGLSAQNWTGTWSTTYGELRLIQQGKAIYGDYGNNGPIAGTYDAATKTLTGSFDNGTRTGTFIFLLSGEGFKGQWAYGKALPSSKWEGTRTSTARPTLKFGKAKNNPAVVNYGVNKAQLGQLSRQKMNSDRMVINRTATTKVNSTIPAPSANNSSRPTEPKPGTRLSLSRSAAGYSEDSKGSPQVAEENNSGYICTTTEYTVDASFDENYILSGSQSYLFPGSIIDGVAFSNGRVNPTGGNRRPYKISADVGRASATVTEATLSGVREALSKALPKSETPARIQFESRIVKSDKDLRLMLKAGYDDGMTNVKGSAKYSTRERKNLVTSRFTQVYYQISADRPAMDAQNQVRPDAVYTDRSSISQDEMIVSEVGFGRQIIILTETNYSSNEVEGTLNFIGNYGGQKITTDLSAKQKEVIENSKFYCFVMGGSAGEGARLIASRGEDLMQVIQQGAQFGPKNPALPVYYKLRFLKDWTEASVKFSSTITKTDCVQSSGVFDVSFDHIGVINAADGDDTENFYGIGWARLFVPVYDPATRKTVNRQIEPINNSYIGSYGRIFEIGRDDAVNLVQGDSRRLMSGSYRFAVRASDYGYASFEDMAKKAFFKIVFEVKERDSHARADDMLGKAEKTVYLADAYIDNRNVGRSQVVKKTRNEGALTSYKGGSTRPIVLFSITPVSGN